MAGKKKVKKKKVVRKKKQKVIRKKKPAKRKKVIRVKTGTKKQRKEGKAKKRTKKSPAKRKPKKSRTKVVRPSKKKRTGKKPANRFRRRAVSKPRTKRAKSKPSKYIPKPSSRRTTAADKRAAQEALKYELLDEQAKRDKRNKRRRELWAAKPEAEKERIRAARRAKYHERKYGQRVTEGFRPDTRPRWPRVEIKYINVGDIDYLNNQPQIEDSRYNLTSHFHIRTPDANTVPSYFEAAFKGKLQYSALEADEISIYKYGIVIRPEFGVVNAEIEHELLSIMEEMNVGGSIIVVHESPTVDSIHIKLGDSADPLLAGDISNLMAKYGDLWKDIWNYLDNHWDGMIWMVEWDVDELMGGS